MTREIKFRAWLKKDKVMTGKVLQITDNPSVQYIKFDKIEKWEGNHLNNPTFADLRDVVLMQYTGLKDNNGTKIFEGDIVEVRNVGLCEVVFENGAFLIRKPSFNGLLHQYTLDGAVVGNIYINPELLGGANE